MSAGARSRRHGQEGQSLVLVALAMVALLGMVSLLIDAGSAWAQQRDTQNAVDSTAEAGSLVLMDNVAAISAGLPAPHADADVLAAVDAKASANGLPAPTAYYTDLYGQCILTSGLHAAPPCSQYPTAVQVGSGSIPTVSYDAAAQTANGQGQRCPIADGADPATTPAPACGVAVYGTRSGATHVGGIFALLPNGQGIYELATSADATAVAGAVTNICGADEPCGFLPVTFPTSLTLCDGTNRQINFGANPPYEQVSPPLTAANESIIPLCKTANGSVGWLAIQPEDGNGVSDLANDITTPDNPPLNLPVWIQTQTGNTNSSQVDTAVNAYDGKQVVIPLYDCIDNGVGQLSPGPSCPNPPQTGVGNNTYYHLVGILGFKLDHAYINASNPECNQAPGGPPVGGNGSTGCLKGWIVSVSLPATGNLGVGSSGQGTAFGVQLIR